MVSAFHSAVQTRPVQAHVAPAAPPLPARYVRVPQKLLTTAAYDPLAAGLYALIARLYLIVQSPLSLSTADVQRYDPALSRGAVLRAFDRLLKGGWLLAQEQVGHKTTYVPAWGRIEGRIRPWQMDAPALGRPRHLHALALDLRLLDLYLGKLTLHPTRPALVTRYVTQPLLSLRDVGAYALTLSGIPTATPALVAWNLVHGELCAPIPADEDVLTRVSEGVQGDEHTSALTLKGVQRLGLIAPTLPQLATVEPAALIGEVIGEGITNVIGDDDSEYTSFSASGRTEMEGQGTDATNTWESLGEHVSHGTPPPPPPEELAGGGMISADDSRADRAAPRAASETARLLHTLNVRPRQVAELADAPLDVVLAAVADGQARPYVRDLAGWVVAMVRDARDHGWKVDPPALRSDAPEALRTAFAQYAAQQETEHAVSVDGEDSVSIVVMSETADLPADAHIACDLPAPTDVLYRPDELTVQLRQALKQQTPRMQWATIDGLTVRVHNDEIIVACANQRSFAVVQQWLLGALRLHLNELGLHMPIRVIIASACSSDVVSLAGDGRPAWIPVERWLRFPMLLRAALHGATLEGEIVRGATPHLTAILQARYATEIAALLTDLKHDSIACN